MKGPSSSRYSEFACRLCRKKHPLKSCWKFRAMNSAERLNAVKKYGYCMNCLAHTHSQGTCFTTTGCGYCHKKHHSLLHQHPRLQKAKSSSTKNTNKMVTPLDITTPKDSSATTGSIPRSTSTSSITSLSALLRQNATPLLPTAVVKINGANSTQLARCLLDSAAPMSCISKRFVDKLGLSTLELEDEVMCPVTLTSCVDSKTKIEAILRMRNRIGITTPKQSLPESSKLSFKNFVLADSKFYKAASVDIVIGVDIYSKIIVDGIFIRHGLPTAQNTLFGLVLYGTFSN